MSDRMDALDQQVPGPVIDLAAKVRSALAGDVSIQNTDYGAFYVGRVELTYDGEVVAYLTPDEGDGSTYDLWTPKKPEATR